LDRAIEPGSDLPLLIVPVTLLRHYVELIGVEYIADHVPYGQKIRTTIKLSRHQGLTCAS
jgi:hypothetical protein